MNFCRCIAVFMFLLLCGCQETLYTNISEIEANEMLAVLISNGVKAGKVKSADGNLNINVDKSTIPLAVNLLQQHGLPRQEFVQMGEVFKKEGLISSPLEERVRYIYALSQSISSTLSQIDGVITARVHIVLPEDNAFKSAIKPASASIYIKYNPKYNLESESSKIKLIVEKSVAGLTYEKISLVMLPSRFITQQHSLLELSLNNSQDNNSWFWIVGGIILAFTLIGGLYVVGSRDDLEAEPINTINRSSHINPPTQL